MKNQSLLTLTSGVATVALALLFLSPQVQAQSKEELQSQVTQLQGQLSRAKAEIARLQADAKRAREMPVRLSKRKALTGSGEVLKIENISTRTMPLKVTLMNPTFGRTNVFDLVLDAAQVSASAKEIGHLQGWAAAPGDIVLVESMGYDPIGKRFE